MPPAARKGDPHSCPASEGSTPHVGGEIDTGSPDVEIEFAPAARAGVDTAPCKAGSPSIIRMGSGTVEINNKLAARVGDETTHGGVILGGAATVFIGVEGDAVEVLPIDNDLLWQGRDQDPSTADDSPAEEEKNDDDDPYGNQQSESDGNIFARFEIIRPRGRIIENDVVSLQCTSWDPDTGGTSESPNSNAIVRRVWEISGASGRMVPVVQVVDQTTRHHNHHRFTHELQVTAPMSVDHITYEPIKIKLTVTDGQGHVGTAWQDIRLWSKDVPIGVFPRWSIESPADPRYGEEITFRCSSWDPDTGGTRDTPNPEQIRQRSWSLRDAETGELISFQKFSGGELTWTTTAGSHRGQSAESDHTSFVVEIEVTDQQGHRAKAANRFDVRNAPSPRAVITPVLAGQIAFGSTTRLVRYRCDSYYDKARSPMATPDEIVTRTWRAAIGSRSVPVNILTGPMSDREVEIPEHVLAESIRIEKPVVLRLDVRNRFGISDYDVIEATHSIHKPVARISRNVINNNSRILRGWRTEYLPGDRIRVESESLLDIYENAAQFPFEEVVNQGITRFKWTVDMSPSVGPPIVGYEWNPYVEFTIPYNWNSDNSWIDRPVSIIVSLEVSNTGGSSRTLPGPGATARHDLYIHSKSLFDSIVDDLLNVGKAIAIGAVAIVLLKFALLAIGGTVVLAGGAIKIGIMSAIYGYIVEKVLVNRAGMNRNRAKQVVSIAQGLNGIRNAYQYGKAIRVVRLRREIRLRYREIRNKYGNSGLLSVEWSELVETYHLGFATAGIEVTKKGVEESLKATIQDDN
jgi:uncharacterized Zn-binding protein involved in type VI secretion